MNRLFIALRPPPPVRSRLLDIMQDVPGARWQSDEQLHLTLKFIGDVDRHQLADVAAALCSIAGAPLDLDIAGVGSFGARGRTEALWAGVRSTAGLDRLHKAVDRAVRTAGIAEEARAFRPHITVARLSRNAGPADLWLAAHAGLSIPAARFAHLYLYESELGRNGSTYTVIERYPLAGLGSA